MARVLHSLADLTMPGHIIPHPLECILCYTLGMHITSHCITSHHITPHRITSHRITSHHITSHHTCLILSCPVLSSPLICPRFVVSLLCHAIIFHHVVIEEADIHKNLIHDTCWENAIHKLQHTACGSCLASDFIILSLIKFFPPRCTWLSHLSIL